MSNAYRDENSVPTLIGVLNSDGATITRIKVNATNHGLKVTDSSSGADSGPDEALHDENGVPTLLAVSSTDGVTPVVIYADSSGNLLVDSS